ncbi:hypothetical protein [Sphingomonas sp. OTU376]|uniref:hypothetical protein n=1 Tax=Sphingomonas sp. OTU376 TaxID=3043863 RepID=UPI00313BE250
MLVKFHGLQFDLPAQWADVTDDLPEGSPPTLARPSGVGAIQFTTAVYRAGLKPDVTNQDLRNLVVDFCNRLSFRPGEFEERTDRLISAGCVVAGTDDLTAVWYVSNGRDIALITYSGTGWGEPSKFELCQARQIVATVEFDVG